MNIVRAPRFPRTRRRAHFARWVAVLALAALAIVVFLPALVNGQVNRILRGLMARGAAEFRLVHAGLHRSDIAISVDDGDPEGPSLEVASCVIAYRPLRLLAGHIDSVSLGGVVLHVVATNGVFTAPAATLFAASDKPAAPFSLKRLMDVPVTLDHLSLGGHVVVHADSETLVIPVKAEATIRNETGWDEIDASARLRFSSSALDIVAQCRPGAETIHAQIRLHAASDALPVLFRAQIPKTLQRAVVDMTTKTALTFDGTVLSQLDIEAQTDVAAETPYGMFTLKPVLTAAGDRETVKASLTNLAADVGGVRIALDATNLVANLATQSLEGTLALGIATNAPFAFTFNVAPDGFSARLANSPGGTVSLGAIQATYADVRFEAKGTRDPATGDDSAVAQFGFGGLALRDTAGRLLGSIDTGATGEATASLSGGVLDCKASALMEAIAIPLAETALRRIALDATYRVTTTGEATAAASARAGATFRDVELAQLDATLQLTSEKEVALEANVAALGVSGTLNTTASFNDTGKPCFDMALDIPEQALDFTSLHGIVPELADYVIGGKLAAAADYHITQDDRKGSLKVRFNEGTLNCPEQELSVSDIRASFEMPSLPSLASNSQFFGFKDLKAGPFSMDSGMAIFRMQSPQVWFLDKLILDWCGGKVRGESTRIARANKNTWITLHADQLRLADLLAQFDIGSDAGETPDEGGKLSGTIPMVITQGKIAVRDGYFHSAPGKTGRIRLHPAPHIHEMAGTSIQTSLALDALTDFTYNWIRIVMNSEDEELLLKFEMDGRPSNKLNYSVRDGEIVRSRNASQFEGLVLDTNFRIPLNELLSIALPLTKSLQDATNE